MNAFCVTPMPADRLPKKHVIQLRCTAPLHRKRVFLLALGAHDEMIWCVCTHTRSHRPQLAAQSRPDGHQLSPPVDRHDHRTSPILHSTIITTRVIRTVVTQCARLTIVVIIAQCATNGVCMCVCVAHTVCAERRITTGGRTSWRTRARTTCCKHDRHSRSAPAVDAEGQLKSLQNMSL
jgi:hypothetical protein